MLYNSIYLEKKYVIDINTKGLFPPAGSFLLLSLSLSFVLVRIIIIIITSYPLIEFENGGKVRIGINHVLIFGVHFL